MTSAEGDAGSLSGTAGAVEEAFDRNPALLIALTGPDLRISAVNAACRAFLGRSEFIGRPVREALPELVGQQLAELADRVYASGAAAYGREWRVHLTRPDGSVTESYLDFALTPVRAASGAIRGLVGAGMDVTRRVLSRPRAPTAGDDAPGGRPAAPQLVASLQAALLPTALPALPQVRIAGRYLVAGEEQAAGGDWFDAVLLAGGRVALVVGDVVGHGLAAAAAMAQLRAVISELLTAEKTITSALARADAFAARTPGLRTTTLVLAVLDPADGTLLYTTCGHPPPLVVSSDGRARFLPATGSGPLGTGSALTLARARLEVAEVLLLYSDGLVERPGRTHQLSSTELAAVAGAAVANRALPAGAADAPAERACQLAVELLTRTGYADDVTALAAERLSAPVAPRHLELPSRAQSLRVIRGALDDWLTGIGPLPDDCDALHMAVVEVVTNGIEHAYPPGQPGILEFDLLLRPDGVAECRVTDYGRWRPPDSSAAHRGNGLMVARHMVDELTISHPAAEAGPALPAPGTVVTIRHRLRRPALLASDASAQAAAFPAGPEFEVDTALLGGEASARVCGPVDISTADELLRRLLAACRGGTLSLTVDLSGVTRLASTGVSVLFELTRQLAAHRRDLRLVAPADGAADPVLRLVGLRHLPGPRD